MVGGSGRLASNESHRRLTYYLPSTHTNLQTTNLSSRRLDVAATPLTPPTAAHLRGGVEGTYRGEVGGEGRLVSNQLRRRLPCYLSSTHTNLQSTKPSSQRSGMAPAPAIPPTAESTRTPEHDFDTFYILLVSFV